MFTSKCNLTKHIIYSMASTTTGTARGESPSTVSGSIYEEFSPGKKNVISKRKFSCETIISGWFYLDNPGEKFPVFQWWFKLNKSSWNLTAVCCNNAIYNCDKNFFFCEKISYKKTHKSVQIIISIIIFNFFVM